MILYPSATIHHLSSISLFLHTNHNYNSSSIYHFFITCLLSARIENWKPTVMEGILQIASLSNIVARLLLPHSEMALSVLSSMVTRLSYFVLSSLHIDNKGCMLSILRRGEKSTITSSTCSSIPIALRMLTDTIDDR